MGPGLLELFLVFRCLFVVSFTLPLGFRPLCLPLRLPVCFALALGPSRCLLSCFFCLLFSFSFSFSFLCLLRWLVRFFFFHRLLLVSHRTHQPEVFLEAVSLPSGLSWGRGRICLHLTSPIPRPGGIGYVVVVVVVIISIVTYITYLCGQRTNNSVDINNA